MRDLLNAAIDVAKVHHFHHHYHHIVIVIVITILTIIIMICNHGYTNAGMLLFGRKPLHSQRHCCQVSIFIIIIIAIIIIIVLNLMSHDETLIQFQALNHNQNHCQCHHIAREPDYWPTHNIAFLANQELFTDKQGPRQDGQNCWLRWIFSMNCVDNCHDCTAKIKDNDEAQKMHNFTWSRIIFLYHLYCIWNIFSTGMARDIYRADYYRWK